MTGIRTLQTAALVRDTFREALARKIFWGLFAISTVMILFFIFLLGIDVVEGATVTVSLFGQSLPSNLTVNQLVRAVHAAVAVFLYTFGMFLAVFASSGLLPSLIEPGRIELLLSKPIGRLHLLLGRYLGNLLVVAFNTIFLVCGVWLVFGFKAGIWSTEFLVVIPAMMFLFAVLLAVVVLVGVAFESPALATMIPVALMIMSPILAQEQIAVKLLSSDWSRQVWSWLYWVFPKIHDVGRITLKIVRSREIESWEPFFSSGIFGLASLALAVFLFRRKDY